MARDRQGQSQGTEPPAAGGLPDRVKEKEGFRQWLIAYHRYAASNDPSDMAKVGPMRQAVALSKPGDFAPVVPESTELGNKILSDLSAFVGRARWVHARLSVERALRPIPPAEQCRETIYGILGYARDLADTRDWTDLGEVIDVLLLDRSPSALALPRRGMSSIRQGAGQSLTVGYYEVYPATLDLTQIASGIWRMVSEVPDKLEEEVPSVVWGIHRPTLDGFRRLRELVLAG